MWLKTQQLLKFMKKYTQNTPKSGVQKYVLVSFKFLLSVGLEIAYTYRYCTKLFVSFSNQCQKMPQSTEKKFKETRNLVKFLYVCKISSPTDKRNLNETNTFFLHRISGYFKCIFS